MNKTILIVQIVDKKTQFKGCGSRHFHNIHLSKYKHDYRIKK